LDQETSLLSEDCELAIEIFLSHTSDSWRESDCTMSHKTVGISQIFPVFYFKLDGMATKNKNVKKDE